MRRGRRGQALVMTLMILTAVSVLAATSLVTLRTLTKETVYQKRLLQAQALAEAGANDALRQLVSSATWRTGFNQKPLAGGWYTVTLSTHARPWITSTGYAPSVAGLGRPLRSVKFKAGVSPIPRMQYALLSRKDVDFSSFSYVDSYNSEVDPAPLVFGSSVTVWANDDVWTDPVGIAVFGGVLYRDDTTASAATVTGSIVKTTYTLTAPYTDGTAYKTDNDNLTGVAPQSFYNTVTRDFRVPAGSTATIKSGVYFFDDFDVYGTLDLVLTNGPVIVFIDANSNWSGTIRNPSRIPANFIVYAQQLNSITINLQEKFYGLVEARVADFYIDSEIYGAVVGDDIHLRGIGKLHYDLSLLRPKVNAVRVVPGTWQAQYKKQ